MKRRLAAFVLIMMTVFSMAGCESKATADLCDPIVREYMEAKTGTRQAAILYAQSGTNLAFQALSFQWDSSDCKRYRVSFADNPDYQEADIYETPVAAVTPNGTFIPGKTYYWKVENAETGALLQEDSFTLRDAPVRFITTTSVPNVRDLGGWKTEDGKKVKYEMIYRGGITNTGEDNNFPEKDAALFRDVLGIQTEIDLRTPGKDDYGQTVSILGEDAAYYKLPMEGYCSIIPGFRQGSPVVRLYSQANTDSIREIFHILADPDNYPVYLHCNAGADRTGTIAYLINGVLGVSYEDLTRDYELTSFSQSGRRWRSEILNTEAFDSSGVMQDDSENYVAWDKMHRMMEENYGGKTLQETTQNYLTQVCGVPQEDIDSLRSIMLNES